MAAPMICYPAIEERRSDLGVPKQRMAEYLGISLSALENKLSGRNEFKFSEVTRLSEWWGTPLSVLAEGSFRVDRDR